MAEETKTIAARVEPSLKQRVKDAKWDLRMNETDIIRRAVIEYLDREVGDE
jgi:hypothetical protein